MDGVMNRKESDCVGDVDRCTVEQWREHDTC